MCQNHVHYYSPNFVQGIKIADEEMLLSQFTDDNTFFLDSTRDCFCSCIRILQHSASMSCIQLNYVEFDSTSSQDGVRVMKTTTKSAGNIFLQCR